MRVLRRFPALEPALRDGRLCLSTVTLLGPLLATDTLDELVARAAYRTKADVEHLVATMNPRAAPREGVRKVPERAGHGKGTAATRIDQPMLVEDATSVVAAQAFPTRDSIPAHTGAPMPSATPASAVLALPAAALVQVVQPERANLPIAQWAPSSDRGGAPELMNAQAPPRGPSPAMPAPPPVETRHRVEMRPVSADEWSLRVTIDSALRADLETLRNLLSHSTRGDLAAVLREAIRCGIEKHGKRKGMVKPSRERAASVAGHEPGPGTRAVPAAVRRQVWERDGGCCTWIGTDGRRCGSRWKLELDHVRPVALGGASTADNVRILCRRHNSLHAAQVFGREHMARFETRSFIPG